MGLKFVTRLNNFGKSATMNQCNQITIVEDKSPRAFRGRVTAEVFLNVCMLVIIDAMTLVTCNPCQIRYQTCLPN